MFGDHFYHATIRKSVAIFGTIFNNISVVRRNSGGEAINQIKVPLAYGPKQKFISRIDSLGNDQKSMAIKMPRMSFEITGIDLDTTSKLNRTNAISQANSLDPTKKDRIKLQTAYNISMELNILAKNQDDGLQILEQILPYFQPEYSVTIKPIDGWSDYKEDVPITLKDVSINDDYEGDAVTRRVLIYTLNFEVKMRFFGPETISGLIREINIDFFNKTDSSFLEGLNLELNPRSDPFDADSPTPVTTTIDLLYVPDTFTITLDDAAGFAVDDTIIGSSSASTAKVTVIDNDSPDSITVTDTDGYFYIGETITVVDSSPAVSATVDSWV